MNFLILVIITLGLISTFQVSIWNTRFVRYGDFLHCPATFSNSGFNRFLYWCFPISLFILTIILYKFHVLLFLIYFLPIIAGILKVKKEHIDRQAKFIMEQERISFSDAKKKAKRHEKSIRMAKKYLP